MSEIINETINELNKPTENNIFSIEDDPVTILEKINQVERYLKQIDTHVDTSINTANEALEKANSAFEANGTLVKINGENQLTWSADFAESERQKSKNLFPFGSVSGTKQVQRFISLPAGTYTLSAIATSSDTDANTCLVGFYNKTDWIGGGALARGTRQSITVTLAQPTLSLIFFASNNQPNSEGDTFTYADIQIEKGSAATDYQPYNGAIVHEKEIADVEHIETIYDMSSSDSNINKGYTAGKQFDNNATEMPIDLGDYKKLRLCFKLYKQTIVYFDFGIPNNTYFTMCAVCMEPTYSVNNPIMLSIYYSNGNLKCNKAVLGISEGSGNLNNSDNAVLIKVQGVK